MSFFPENCAMPSCTFARSFWPFHRALCLRRVRAVSLLLLFILLATALSTTERAFAQSTLGAPTPNNSAGAPLLSTVEQSAHEQLSLANGSVSFSVPVVSFPQRGGGALNLALVYSSNETYSLKEINRQMGVTCGAENQVDGPGCFNLTQAQIGWVPNQRGPWSGSLHNNLPTLNADLVYIGDNAVPFNCNAGTCYNDFATYCLTNWVFTDWSGAAHPFWGYHNCSNSASFLNSNNPGPDAGDATDGSGYQYNLSIQNDPVVRAPDGTTYHFPAQPGNTMIAATEYNAYSHVFTSIVDRNGNAITAAGSGASYVVTDTLGRQITVNNAGFSWMEQSAPNASPTQRTVSTTYTAGSPVASPFPSTVACVASGSTHTDGTRADIVFLPAGQVSGSSTYTVTLQDGSQYVLETDAWDQIAKVRYPAGGYTRYDFATVGNYPPENEGDYTCHTSWNSVIAKHECSLGERRMQPKCSDHDSFRLHAGLRRTGGNDLLRLPG